MAKNNAVIIKRVKKGGHGHHGGAWKVAYADFVTAMMAFFLLLWLLNATTDAQKRGIADYFSPTLATKSLTSGAGGVLGGQTMSTKGSSASDTSPPGVTSETAAPQNFDDDSEELTPGKIPNEDDYMANSEGDPNSDTHTKKPGEGQPKELQPGQPVKLTTEESKLLGQLNPGKAVDPNKLTDAQFAALKADREDKAFQKAEHDLQQAIQNVPDLKPLARNLVIDKTEEGLRIQLVDQDKTSMFASGDTKMSEPARKLMSLVSQAITQLPNKIAITGHTDSARFAGSGYTNWELSTDRANASRRALIADGMPPDRIATVVGKADTEPMIADDPNNPQNRRVSIVVLRNAPPAPAAPPPAPGKP
jgi:chemotaxis protein MotB